jgi:predicted permease
LNTAIFSVMWSMLRRPLALPESERLVTVHQLLEGVPLSDGFGEATVGGVGGRPRHINGSTDMVSYPEYEAYRTAASLSGLAAFARIGLTLAGEAPASVAGLLVTCDYFTLLRAPLAAGRSFVEDHCRNAGSEPVAVLSHRLWLQRFGGATSVVGSSITLDRTSFTVIGVVAAGFGGTQLQAPDVYLPITMQPMLGEDRLHDEDRSWLELVGRLAPDATTDRARAELASIGRRRDAAYDERETSVLMYRAALVGGPIAERERLLGAAAAFGVAGLIVLLACLNLMNLLLARAPVRQHTARIQHALGASRRRIVTELLVESGTLAVLGGAVGVALAYGVQPVLLTAMSLAGPRSQLVPTLDMRVLAFAALLSAAATLVFGTTPALEATRIDLAGALRGAGAAAAASTAPSHTPRASAAMRSVCGWRSAAHAATSSRSSCARARCRS